MVIFFLPLKQNVKCVCVFVVAVSLRCCFDLWLWIPRRTVTCYNVELLYLYYQANLLFSSACSLANVDPIDVARNITGLNPETTLGKRISFVYLSP